MGFRAVDAALRRNVDEDVIPCASYAVLRGGEVVAENCMGWADREARVPLRPDHLFRAYSNTKLVTSIAALQLVEQGKFRLDDPVAEYIPELARMRVIKDPLGPIEDSTPAAGVIRVSHLLTHTAGFTYHFWYPESPIGKAYFERVRDQSIPLAQMPARLAALPLLFEPGTAWNYSVSIDVVGRLVEIASGLPLDEYFERHIFQPLGMHETFFFVPPEHEARLVRQYIGDPLDPSKPGLERADDIPYPGAFVKPVPRMNPGGGLVTSLQDYTRLVRALLVGGADLLRPRSMHWITDNHLPTGMWIQFPGYPAIAGRGHSFAASVTVEASAGDPTSKPGDIQWGGQAGTHWCVSPRDNIAMVLMTQRYNGYGLPFWTEFKGLARAAALL